MGAADRDRILAALAECEWELDRRNVLPAGALAERFRRLRAVLQAPRLSRVAAVGRRGAGKSSLLNALAGRALATVGDVRDETRHGAWHALDWCGRAIEWHDTPGLRAAGRAGRREQVVAEVCAAAPDVLLVLCQASEVDAGVDADLEDAQALLLALGGRDRRRPAVVGVVTKVDELAPPDVCAPPFEDAEKRENIARAVRVFGAHLRRAGLAPASVVPVNAYARFTRDGQASDDMRWNLGALRERVAALLPREDDLAGALRVDEVRALLHGAFADVTDTFCALLPAGASLAERDALVFTLGRLLRGMGPEAARVVRARRAMGPPRGALGWVRGAMDRLGPDPGEAALRRTGRVMTRLLLDGVGDETIRALFDAKNAQDPAPG